LPDSFYTHQFIEDIYLSLSTLSFSKIDIPSGLFTRLLNNTWDDFPKFLEYFTEQVSNISIVWMQSTDYPIPKSWYFLPDSLRDKIKKVPKVEIPNRDLKDAKEAMEKIKELRVTQYNPQKLVAINDDLEHHEPKQIVEKLKHHLEDDNLS
jgi:hypothetical protein